MQTERDIYIYIYIYIERERERERERGERESITYEMSPGRRVSTSTKDGVAKVDAFIR